MGKHIQSQAIDLPLAKFTDKAEIKKFLNDFEIAKISEVTHVECYDRNSGRKSVIASVKENGKEGHLEILVDFKFGQPCTQQAYEAIYGAGQDCFKRVIVFTGKTTEPERTDPSANTEVVSSLIACMNTYGVGIHLFKVDDQSQSELVDLKPYEASLFTGPHSLKDLPSKEQFLEAEFWQVFYASNHTGHYYPDRAFNGGIVKRWRYGQWCDLGGLKITNCWDSSGAQILIGVGDFDQDFVTQLWLLEKDELIKRYPGHEVGLVNNPGKLPRINIKLWDLPISWLVGASSREKIACSEILYKEYWDLIEFVENALSEMQTWNASGGRDA